MFVTSYVAVLWNRAWGSCYALTSLWIWLASQIMAVIFPLDKHTTNKDGALAALLAEDARVIETLMTERHHYGVMSSPLSNGTRPDITEEIITHLIASGGKRLRALLTLASAYLCHYRGDVHYALATCIELIHNATLLHDDVVDSSAMRRGKKTAHLIWGNKASILVGDFMLARAFQLMLRSDDSAIHHLMCETASCIAEGEVMQLAHIGAIESTEHHYVEIITAKTARLFATACRIGAMLAKKSPSAQQALESFGLNLGIAFQITDDILDYQQGRMTLHKKSGNDFFEGKITLPVILAFLRSDPIERQFWQRCLQERKAQQEDFPHAIHLIKKYHIDRDCLSRAQHYATIAKESLSLFEKSPWRNALVQSVDDCLLRAENA